MQKQQIVTWIVVATLVWFGISVYWYTCGIKGFCGNTSTEINTTVIDRDNSGVTGGVSRNITTTKEVVTTSEEIVISCDSYLDSYIRLNYNNNQSDVTRLQEFLNSYEGESLNVDGIYSTDDVEAVNRFQEKYRAQVLDPYGIAQPTGYVFRTTREQINALQCAYEYAEQNN